VPAIAFGLQYTLALHTEHGAALSSATLTEPLALDAQWTSAAWALEAAGLVWLGLHQAQLLPRVTGYLLYLVARASLVFGSGPAAGEIPLVTGSFLGLAMLSVGGLMIAYCLERTEFELQRREPIISLVALILGWSA
jgi:uncharacterized membrane protein